MVSVLWTIRIPDERSEQKGAMSLRGNGRRGESGSDGVDDGGWNRDLSHVFDRVNASARLPPNSIKFRARRVPDQTLTKRAWEVYGSPCPPHTQGRSSWRSSYIAPSRRLRGSEERLCPTSEIYLASDRVSMTDFLQGGWASTIRSFRASGIQVRS